MFFLRDRFFSALLLFAIMGVMIGAVSAEAPYQAVKTWDAVVPGSGESADVNGIDVDGSGVVYLSTMTYGILKFTSDGVYIGSIQVSGQDDSIDLLVPEEIAVDSAGNVYVLDMYSPEGGFRYRVTRISPDGSSMTEVVNESTGKEITGLDVDTSNRLHVYIDTTNSFDASAKNDQIRIYSPEGGLQATLAVPDEVGPHLAIGPDGRYYLGLSAEISVLDATGTKVDTWGNPGPEDGQLNQVDDIAVDAQGSVFTVDYWNTKVQKFTSGGNFLVAWTMVSPDPPVDPVMSKSVATDSSGNVYVAIDGSGKVQKFAPSGSTQPVVTLPGGATYAQARDYYLGGRRVEPGMGRGDCLIRDTGGRRRVHQPDRERRERPGERREPRLVKSVSTAYQPRRCGARDTTPPTPTARARRRSARFRRGRDLVPDGGRRTTVEALFNGPRRPSVGLGAGTEYGDGTAHGRNRADPERQGRACRRLRDLRTGPGSTRPRLSGAGRGQRRDLSGRPTSHDLFTTPRSSPELGADATTNYNIL